MTVPSSMSLKVKDQSQNCAFKVGYLKCATMFEILLTLLKGRAKLIVTAYGGDKVLVNILKKILICVK